MEKYIALLLLIAPGFISKHIYEGLSHEKRAKSNLNETVSALIFSIFVILLNYIIMQLSRILNNTDFNSIFELFKIPHFVIIYILLTLFNSIYIGILWGIIYPKSFSFINKLRKYLGENELENIPSLLASLNDGKSHVIKIQKEGIPPEAGTISRFDSSDGEIKSLSLSNTEEYTDEILNTLEIKEKYFNVLDGNTTIIEYDTSFFNDQSDEIDIKSILIISTSIYIIISSLIIVALVLIPFT